MKVAYMFGSLNRGGAETLMLDVFRNFCKKNIEIFGIYRKNGALLDDFIKTNTPLSQIKPHFIIDPVYILQLRKTLKKNHINIIHAHQAIDAIYAKIACIGLEIKVVLTFHGYNYKYGKLNNFLTQKIINRTDLNIYVSRSQRKRYSEKYFVKNEIKQIVIYNGISFEKLNNIKQTSLRHENNIPKSSLLLGSVGNFVPVRDQLTICKALDILDKNSIDFAFIFAGAKSKSYPQLYDDCVNFCNINKISDKVHFLGSRNDIPNILHQLDAFVYSTNHDTFGIALIEAIASGVPVFYNDHEVLEEVCQNGELGIMYKSKNFNDIFNKFMDYLGNKKYYIDKAQADALRVEQMYDIENHINKLEEEYLAIHDS